MPTGARAKGRGRRMVRRLPRTPQGLVGAPRSGRKAAVQVHAPAPPFTSPPHTPYRTPPLYHPLPPSTTPPPPPPPPTLPPPPARASALLACTSHNASRRRYASGRRTRPPSGSALRMLQRPIASGSHRGDGSSSLGCLSFPTFPHRPPLLSSLAYCPSHGCSCQRRC